MHGAATRWYICLFVSNIWRVYFYIRVIDLTIHEFSSELGVYAYAAAQVKKAMEVECSVIKIWKCSFRIFLCLLKFLICHKCWSFLLWKVTHYLGGENYVFWGGREGYQTLLNTDMKRELDHLVEHNFLYNIFAAFYVKIILKISLTTNSFLGCFSSSVCWL